MNEVFTAASHHDILVLLFQLSILLFTARMLGEFAQRLGQPTVVGEIFAGILLGPSLISGLIPALGQWIVPQTEVQGYLLEVVSLLGVMFLLIVTGLEINIPLIRSQARSAVGVAVGGLLLPLAMGFALGQMLPDNLLVDPDQRFVFALFLATSMSISAIPVVAKVLLDLNLTRRDIGQTIIAAAMIDDTTGWIMLSVVIGLAGGASVTVGSVLQSVITVLAFLIISFTAGQWIVNRLFDFVQNRLEMRDKVLSLIVLCMFVWGTITQLVGLEALLGAFITGVVFGQVRGLSPDVVHKIESIALGIFAPIFFAIAGLKVNALNLFTPDLFLTTILVIGVAVVCKILGVYIGSRLIGKADHWTALFFGAGLNARGSMEIIVATIGLTLGVLTQDMFSIIVVMAVFTSVMAPFLLRWALTHIEPSQQELKRLEQEKLTSESLIANVHRVLLPVRLRDKKGASHLIESLILEKLRAKNDISLTLVTIVDAEHQAQGKAFLDELEALFAIPSTHKKVLTTGQKPVRDLILEEARRGYDLMILGAAEKQTSGSILFTPVVDDLIRLSPCPTMIVQGGQIQEAWTLNRILVPSNGSLEARRAAEVAFSLADEEDEVHLLQVVEKNPTSHYTDAMGTLFERQMMTAKDNIDSLRQIGMMQNVNTVPDVQVGGSPETVILESVQQSQTDLIILGTSVGVGGTRLYLGPRVERILNNAPCPVIVINS